MKELVSIFKNQNFMDKRIILDNNNLNPPIMIKTIKK